MPTKERGGRWGVGWGGSRLGQVAVREAVGPALKEAAPPLLVRFPHRCFLSANAGEP